MRRAPTPASKGEKELFRCCEQFGINAVSQKSFPDLRGTRGGLLRFDAFTTNTQPPFLIEYQGKGTHGREAIASFGHRNGRERIPKALQHFIKANKIRIMKTKKTTVTKTTPSWSFFAIVLLAVLFGALAKPKT